jgi:hypothetical protein
LLQQQVVPFHHNLVAGVESVDDFHSVVALNPSLHLTLLVSIAFGNENNRLPLVIENR